MGFLALLQLTVTFDNTLKFARMNFQLAYVSDPLVGRLPRGAFSCHAVSYSRRLQGVIEGACSHCIQHDASHAADVASCPPVPVFQ